MNFKDIIATANANLLRSKLRTALTILAIFIGAFTLSLTSGIGAGISKYVDSQVNNLGSATEITISVKSDSASTMAADEPQKYIAGEVSSGFLGSTVKPMTDADIDTLKQISELSDVTPSRRISPTYIQGTASDKYKVSLQEGSASNNNLDLASGKDLDITSSEPQVILPISFVSVIGYGSNDDVLGQTVTIAVTDANETVHEAKATVVGIQNKGITGGSSIVVNKVLADSLFDKQSIGLSEAKKSQYASVTANFDANLSEDQIAALKQNLSDKGYDSSTRADTLGSFQTILSAIVYVLDAFAIIALLAASFGIINTLFMSVQERTKEIGLMKAMGMPNTRIFALFSVEAILIGFWGSVVGIVGAIGVGAIANQIIGATILKDLPGFTLIVFPVANVLLIAGLIMLIAFLAGALPARKASKQNPIDALRYE